MAIGDFQEFTLSRGGFSCVSKFRLLNLCLLRNGFVDFGIQVCWFGCFCDLDRWVVVS